MMPKEHAGITETRIWYKVKWVKSPEGMDISGRIDLLTHEDLKIYGKPVSVIEPIRVKSCSNLSVLGFGKLTEKQIDDWIEKNKL